MGKRVAIVGAGAVGGYTGGQMARNGVDVTFIDPYPAHVEAMRTKGLELTGVSEQEHYTVPVKAMHVTEVQSLAKQDPIDIAIISAKSYDTEWAAALIKQYLAPEGFAVSLQNCVNEERLAGVVGWGRTVGCIASTISVELKEPGLIQRNVPIRGEKYTVFRCGELHGRITKRVEELVDWLRYADSAKATDNLWGERWSKLVINSSHNGLSACTGYSGNDMCTVEAPRRLSIRLAAETIRVGRAHGFNLETIKGHEADAWVAAADGDAAALDAIETSLIESAKERGDEQRPSMGQDIAKGRRTEIDFLNGLVVEKGREAGIPTPANEGIIEAVKKVERGEVAQSPDLIDGI
ncbi:MAG: 2-dehydropantoate 2-reductase [Alphaproteobacteria bacterium]|nr:2-dehydropantoate 2-reductase [Alphaproteobacteria bacterium]